MNASVGLQFAQPLPDRLPGRQPLVAPVCGWLTGEAANVERVMIEVDGRAAGELRLDEPVPPRLWRREDLVGKAVRGFAGEVRLESRGAPFEHSIKFVLMTESRDHWQVCLCSARREEVERADPRAQGQAPRIAVCMAVYNPETAAFERQVRSIVDQRREDWICIVNDDGSDAEHAAAIRRILAADSRFHYFRNSSNVGFYRNFETALARVPDGVEYVALADQDDRWYPDKLSTLVDALSGDAVLAYSDMRIVSEDDDELAPSYWGYRMNSYRNLDLMLVANTVTGAACMMRRELVDVLLPFPPRVGDAFHDHWIACAALAGGRINYVDRPLYDYIQYGSSVIGHCRFDVPSTTRENRAGGRLGWLKPSSLRSLARRFVGAGQAVYWHECRRIEALCRNLLERDAVRPDRRRSLLAYGRGFRSAWSLFVLNLSTRYSARLTDNAERRLAHGYLVHGALRRLQPRH